MNQDPEAMMREHQEKHLWTYFANILLGAWLLAAPLVFGYADHRMVLSDLLSGAAVVVLGTLALRPRFDFIGRWGVSFVGLWLLFAPLFLWTASAAAYASDTLVGMLLIALSILIPMMPGKAHHVAMMQPGPDIPPGWTYNPSSWWQRGPMIGLAFFGFLISRYLAAYQLGHIDVVWDPFFLGGTRNVLESDVSKAWPISDAGLGATSYALEALMGFMGGRARWRTMPSMVLFFFVLVVPLGLTSIVLIILQPLMVGAWCTLCLITAALMLLMIPLAVDEVVAMLQFIGHVKRTGGDVWRTFWIGGTLEGGGPDDRSPQYDAPVPRMYTAAVWGVSVPLTLLASTALGVWLMVAPDVFGVPITATTADSDHLVGALVVTVSVIAWAEVVRPFRLLNALFGAWLITSPLLIGVISPGLRISDLIVGVLLIALSIPTGPVRERYGEHQKHIR